MRRVAENPLELVFGHVAFPAHDLHCIIDDAPSHLRAEDLADGGFEHDVFIEAIEHAGGHVEHGVHRVAERAHVGDLRADELKIGERALELIARLRPLGRLLERGDRAAKHAGRERAPAVVQTTQRNVEPLSLLVQQVRFGDAHIGKANARLPGAADSALAAVLLEDVNSFHIRRADERADLLLAVGHALLGHHSEHGRERAAGGPLFLSVQNEVFTIRRFLAVGFLTAGVAADVGL